MDVSPSKHCNNSCGPQNRDTPANSGTLRWPANNTAAVLSPAATVTVLHASLMPVPLCHHCAWPAVSRTRSSSSQRHSTCSARWPTAMPCELCVTLMFIMLKPPASSTAATQPAGQELLSCVHRKNAGHGGCQQPHCSGCTSYPCLITHQQHSCWTGHSASDAERATEQQHRSLALASFGCSSIAIVSVLFSCGPTCLGVCPLHGTWLPSLSAAAHLQRRQQTCRPRPVAP